MPSEFKLPELGEGVENADISRIYISEGDEIDANQNVMELETEKAVADLPCPIAGRVSKLHVSTGDSVEVGQTLLSIDEVASQQDSGSDSSQDKRADEKAEVKEQSGEDENEEAATTGHSEQSEQTIDQESQKTASANQNDESDRRDNEKLEKPSESGELEIAEKARETESASSNQTMETADKHKDEQHIGTSDASAGDRQQLPPPAGPATRRLARKLEIDLENFKPPKGGRIRSEDVVRAYVERGKAAGLSSQQLPDFSRFGSVHRQPLNKIAETAARRLTTAWRTVPQVTQHGSADITSLESARRRHAQEAAKSAEKITLTAILIKSVAGLLREFPKFNSSLDTNQNELIIKDYCHIGVAVDTAHGLLVPVIRNADRKSIEQIAVELRRVAAAARDRQLGREDFEGGSFTVSNQGGIGGGEFTPIINYPEAAILGVGRARPDLQLIDGRPVERLRLPLSLTYDHRIINGADAARLIERLSQMLSNEFDLLIAT